MEAAPTLRRNLGVATDFADQGIQLLSFVLYAIEYQAEHIFGLIDEGMVIPDVDRPLLTPFVQVGFEDPFDLGRPRQKLLCGIVNRPILVIEQRGIEVPVLDLEMRLNLIHILKEQVARNLIIAECPVLYDILQYFGQLHDLVILNVQFLKGNHVKSPGKIF
jgi:hypothetical protein